jgi:hypothetical protein
MSLNHVQLQSAIGRYTLHCPLLEIYGATVKHQKRKKASTSLIKQRLELGVGTGFFAGFDTGFISRATLLHDNRYAWKSTGLSAVVCLQSAE